jgi:hypothetical protein
MPAVSLTSHVAVRTRSPCDPPGRLERLLPWRPLSDQREKQRSPGKSRRSRRVLKHSGVAQTDPSIPCRRSVAPRQRRAPTVSGLRGAFRQVWSGR